MEIYIVRHGETVWNKKKLLQGSTDIELNEYGRELAIKTGTALENIHLDAIFSSPLKRAYETASLIKNNKDIEITVSPLIRELNFGEFEGQNMTDLIKNDDIAFKYFFDKPELYVPASSGETLNDLIKRAGEFMSSTIEPLEDKYKRVMIVAHGALNKAIMTYVKKHDLSQFWSGGLQPNCNVIILDYSNGEYTIKEETKTFY